MAKSIRDMAAKDAKHSEEQTDIHHDVDEIIGKYSGKSEDELMLELKKVTDQQKRAGQFDEAEVAAAENAILPFLNAQQAEKLKQILESIR